MPAGFKICPHCRRAAGLTRASCRRCGHAFGEATLAYGGTHVFRGRPVTSLPPAFLSRRRVSDRTLFLLTALCVGLCGLLAGLTLSRAQHRARYLMFSHHSAPRVQAVVDSFERARQALPITRSER